MKFTLDQFILKTNFIDKLLISLIFFFPIFLSISIFIADLSASLTALIILVKIILRNNNSIFLSIKRERIISQLGYENKSSQKNERNVDVQVTRLRKKIELDPKTPRFLKTIRGKGYRLLP